MVFSLNVPLAARQHDRKDKMRHLDNIQSIPMADLLKLHKSVV